MAYKEVGDNILVIRGMKVILDSDVAALYQGETKRVNEAVARNKDKFPEGYVRVCGHWVYRLQNE